MNKFNLKFTDNPKDTILEMNGIPLKGVTRINTGMIAENPVGLVVVEMYAESVIDLLCNSEIIVDDSNDFSERVGDIIYNYLCENNDPKELAGVEGLFPHQLGTMFVKVLERLAKEINND
jgi:hypothetical protein